MTVEVVLKMSYGERAVLSNNSAGQKLLQLMEEKKTNLSTGCDTSNSKELLSMARNVAEEIVIFKTHMDMLDDFTENVTGELKDLSRQHNFMLFEDRKFADIGFTVKLQYGKGIYKIAQWADFTNAHSVPGKGILQGLFEVAKEMPEPRGCFLLAQMTAEGNLANKDYTKKTVEMANEMPEFVCGFIGAGSNAERLRELRTISAPGTIIFAPGVQIGKEGDALGQKYATPESAIAAGADIIHVGRGISNSDNQKETAKKYRELGWKSYQQRIKK